MSEQPIDSRPVDNDALADMLSRALQDLPGVVRLEPTLKSTITRFRSASVQGLQKMLKAEAVTAGVGRDGLHFRVTNGVVDLLVDVATDISHSAVSTAQAVQQCAAETINRAGLRPGIIDITILSIESGHRGHE